MYRRWLRQQRSIGQKRPYRSKQFFLYCAFHFSPWDVGQRWFGLMRLPCVRMRVLLVCCDLCCGDAPSPSAIRQTKRHMLPKRRLRNQRMGKLFPILRSIVLRRRGAEAHDNQASHKKAGHYRHKEVSKAKRNLGWFVENVVKGGVSGEIEGAKESFEGMIRDPCIA